MKCYLSLRRRNGIRLDAPAPDSRRRLVSVTIAVDSGFRVLHATCCHGGSTVAVLWEPGLIHVTDDAFLLQGFEKVGGQGAVQEWVLVPYFAGR